MTNPAAPKFDKTAYQREYMRKRRSGEPRTVSVRLDAEEVARWRATGDGWQARMVDTLRKADPSSTGE